MYRRQRERRHEDLLGQNRSSAIRIKSVHDANHLCILNAGRWVFASFDDCSMSDFNVPYVLIGEQLKNLEQGPFSPRHEVSDVAFGGSYKLVHRSDATQPHDTTESNRPNVTVHTQARLVIVTLYVDSLRHLHVQYRRPVGHAARISTTYLVTLVMGDHLTSRMRVLVTGPFELFSSLSQNS